MDFHRLSIGEIARSVQSGHLSAVECVEAALARIEAVNPSVNAFVALDEEGAIDAARRLDARRASGDDVGPLAGVPFGVKDLEDAAGLPTSHGSALFEGAPPARADSVLVSRLRDAGAILIGKTNTPEYGWQPQTYNSLFGTTRNPWNLDHTPGGSSGGSAAAIASGMVPLATGSDGGGSVRIPASLCGLYGFKPSLGRVPLGGSSPPDWPYLSTRAPMARTTSETALALDAVLGPDPTDLWSLPMPEPSWSAALEHAGVPLRVAWSPTLGYGNVDTEVRDLCSQAVGVLAELGAEVVEVESVFPEDPVLTWLTLANAYLFRTFSAAWGTDEWLKIDPGLAHQLEQAADVRAVDVVRAEDECHRLNVRLVELFHEFRLLVTPTTAAPAPRCGEPGVINGRSTWAWPTFTYPFNLTRSPAATVPAGLTKAGLPVGLQLVGPQHGDLVVLRAMAAYEQANGPAAVAPELV